MLCVKCSVPLSPLERGYCYNCGGSARLDQEKAWRNERSRSISSFFSTINDLPVSLGSRFDRYTAAVLDGYFISLLYTVIGLILGMVVYAIAPRFLAPETWFSSSNALQSLEANLTLGKLLLLSGSQTAILILVLPSVCGRAFFEASKWRATPGKLLLGLQVTDTSGQKLYFLQAIHRNLARYLSVLATVVGVLLFPIPVLALLCLCASLILALYTYGRILVDSEQRGLHDLISRTLVSKAFEVSTTRRVVSYILAYLPICMSVVYALLEARH